ncbi:MAG: zinc ribbon domain-containing protein [Chloroflexi bacterium]|nr:zinc ribbon domain-containing protein [Chloroflexota bacterium]MCI0647377.1 zinc ribbon domain-containing protein [Chloroflexota bacterium]MCI0727837.1 zinc ribbon domain-containing protein [Chloroflexota bacterium]
MSDEIFQEVACPNCRNPLDVRQGHGKHITCDACGSEFLLRGHLCPNCSAYSNAEQSICGQCGMALTRICGKCRTPNWAGDEYCVQCGSPMDILDILKRQYTHSTAERLTDQMAEARRLKEIEELASERRMAELMAIEEQRQIELRRRLAQQKQQERTLLVLVFGAIALFLVVLVIYALISG